MDKISSCQTQEEVAVQMGTKASAIARLEGTATAAKASPSIRTLRKYAKAVGGFLEIRLKPLPRSKEA